MNGERAQMNYSRIGLAALCAWIAYFAFGFLLFFLFPGLVEEARKFPNVFRDHESMKSVMPVVLVTTLLAIGVLAVIFALIAPSGSGLADGARFGALAGLFVVCAFVLHNYVNLNIGLKLAVMQSAAYFVQWALVGLVIGVVYKPLAVS